MKSISLKSPAKLNLYLKVINKRADGYHNIETIFERIDLCDEMRLTVRRDRDIRIFCNHPGVPKGPQNLACKAAKLLKDDFALQNGVDIRIKKRIPVAAGLAGGSSNAATTLLGLNKIWKLDLNKQELVSYARKIGSDVPFFIYDYNWAIGTQKGDQIRGLKIDTKLWQILIVPCIKVYTPRIYGNLKLQLTKPNDGVNMLSHVLRKNDLPRIGSLLLNDLETAIVQAQPQLLKLKNKLKELCDYGVAFSGSGPTVFGLVESQNQAKAIKTIINKYYKQVYITRTL